MVKMIVGWWLDDDVTIPEKYILSNLDVIKILVDKQKLELTTNMISTLSYNERTDILDFLLLNGYEIICERKIIDNAWLNKNYVVLEWWKKSGIELTFTYTKELYDYLFHKTGPSFSHVMIDNKIIWNVKYTEPTTIKIGSTMIDLTI